jgi:hypothetical protein
MSVFIYRYRRINSSHIYCFHCFGIQKIRGAQSVRKDTCFLLQEREIRRLGVKLPS